jgi:putative transposase
VKKARKRRPLGTTVPTRAVSPNYVWSYDFVHDETTYRRRLKYLIALDKYTREGLTIHCARSITAGDVVQILQRLFAQWEAPAYVKRDNGPDCIAKRVTDWLHTQHVGTHLLPQGVRGGTGITRALTAYSVMVV